MKVATFSTYGLYPAETGLPHVVTVIRCPDDQVIEPYFAVTTSITRGWRYAFPLDDVSERHAPGMSEADVLQVQIWAALNHPLLHALWRGEVDEFDMRISIRKLGR